MTDNTQPEALRLADAIKASGQFTNLHTLDEASAELRRQHARIAELEAQLEAIGAGGVTGPLMGQPQAMPHWVQYEEPSDVLLIHGKRYAAGIFGKAGFLGPPGTLLRVECGDADCVTLTRVPLSENAGEPVVTRATVIEWLDANGIEVTDRQLGGLFHFSAPPTAPTAQAAPQPVGREPLTQEQVSEIADAAHRECDRLVSSGQCAPRWSAVFAYLLERAHGIDSRNYVFALSAKGQKQ